MYLKGLENINIILKLSYNKTTNQKDKKSDLETKKFSELYIYLYILITHH